MILLLEARDGLFSEDVLTVAANTIDASLWLCTMDGTMLFVNDAAVRALRLYPEDVLQRGWTTLLHPDERDFTLGVVQHAATRREMLSVVCRLRYGCGPFIWTHHVAWPVIGRRRSFYVGLSFPLRPGSMQRQPAPDTVLSALLHAAGIQRRRTLGGAA